MSAQIKITRTINAPRPEPVLLLISDYSKLDVGILLLRLLKDSITL